MKAGAKTKRLSAGKKPQDSLPIPPVLAFCKATADMLRLSILRLLSNDSFSVLELCRIFDCPQSTMSHHLKVLASAGLVNTRREGNTIFYQRAYAAALPALEPLQKAMMELVNTLMQDADVEQRLEEIHAERAQNSERFFRNNSKKLREKQELISEYSLYATSTLELLSASIKEKQAVALEVGPGDGHFLAELSPRFDKVVALDNSEDMLMQARSFAEGHQLGNIEFICGDTAHAWLQEQQVDCVVMCMVLHHVPTPADVFDDLARILKSGGRLFVTEICSHDQEWAKETCGHVWLGFEPDTLTHWAEEAGLAEGNSNYLSQRNGFRIQVREFIKT